MGQKEKIINILKTNGAMTQGSLAESIYNDKLHGPNIYNALMSLVEKEIVVRKGSNPSYYVLSNADIDITVNKTKDTKKIRDVSGDLITNESINYIADLVSKTNNYGLENELITNCLKKFPKNTDIEIVAMKIGLIDITNSTHLSQHKSKISMFELADIISSIPNIDSRIESGDSEIVNEIAKSNGAINLFSFATKYCCYHNRNLYGNDDYSILDTILKKYLPRYFNDITESQINNWQKNFCYNEYNNYITRKLDEIGITIDNRKRKFDHFIWYQNR